MCKVRVHLTLEVFSVVIKEVNLAFFILQFIFSFFQEKGEDSVDVAEPLYMIDNAKFDLVNSKYALTTICNVLMNLVVLEPVFVDEQPIFFHMLKFIINTLPSLDTTGTNLNIFLPFLALLYRYHFRSLLCL